ncbi:hypothetical protein [Nannocystis sp. SCPEA4]|uniref:hypothetical protein n=1 Tax=Nannocystis sp. SCPEA4 TaxID=2996787 RepID=UPI0022701D5E|nr:hypothetical protein [Nannocystis sp. SCPEA4]MCY1060547.1 hypothetical protein [Nannocystis sp. SCPEA4]
MLLLVEAQEAGFASDGHLERLRGAARVIDRYLGPLDLLDEEGRGEAEERLRRLTDRIAQIEDARRRAASEREAAARRQRSMQAHAKARRLTLAGSVATGSGIAALAVMGLGLSIGKTADDRLTALAVQYDEPACAFDKEPCDSGYANFRALRLRENIGDAMFLVGATVGGVLLATGTVLLVVARKQRREAQALELVPAPTAGASGLGLALFGRF